MRKQLSRLKLSSLIAAASMLVSLSAQSTLVGFTGGTVTFNDGTTDTTDNSTSFENVASYVESGFIFEFTFSGAPSAFASIIGDYYSTGNDVVHWHWDEGPFGQVSEVRVSKVDGTTFDLGGFRVSTNTSTGGGDATGSELVSINTDKASSIFNVLPDNWGLGSGPDPLITINPTNSLFDDISWFSFTNDSGSTAVGMGLDNFFLDEAGDPNGTDPTTGIPAPATIFLLAWGVFALRVRRS
ncbi:hypothetical protein [uncultured Paraglaciecola sp.]|uniref:hypothetical protein n=1 Tax=uncultured Paraglaciecola sp. TaxID=1765024 RepID=UPI00261F5A3C|nr:hypothetical protein [uncultured Paraglaciecola sp.]